MRILLAATPATGHVNPIVAVARILIANGHDVVVTSASAYRARIEAAGARFVPLPPGADIDLSDVDKVFPQRKNLPAGLAQLDFDFRHFFIDTIPAQFAGIDALLQTFPADLIVVDTMFGGCLPFLLGARKRRPAIAGLGVTCLLTARADGAPIGLGLPLATDADTRRQYRSIAAEVDAKLLAPARARVDAILDSLGAAPLPAPYIDALVGLHDIFLQPSIPGFEFPGMTLPANLHFVGALPAVAHKPLDPDLVAVLSTRRKTVLVTQGTVANHDLSQLIGPTLAALADRSDVTVLVATGGRPLSAIPGALPENAMAAEFLPFDALMTHIDVFITNGGYGAVTQALRAGVPIVAAGTTEDKQDINARIAWCGVGVDLRTDTPSSDQLRTAIGAVLDDDSYRRRASAMRGDFSEYDAASTIPALLEATVAGQPH